MYGIKFPTFCVVLKPWAWKQMSLSLQEELFRLRFHQIWTHRKITPVALLNSIKLRRITCHKSKYSVGSAPWNNLLWYVLQRADRCSYRPTSGKVNESLTTADWNSCLTKHLRSLNMKKLWHYRGLGILHQ